MNGEKEEADELAGLDFDLTDFDLSDIEDEADLLEQEEEKARGLATLDVLDLGAYTIINVGGTHNSLEYLQHFLIATKAEFEKTGRGDFECVLRWSHSRVNDEDVERFIRAVRSRVSALRAQVPAAKANFKFTRLGYEILPDQRHVALHTCRVLPSLYRELQKQRMKERFDKPAIQNLAKFL